MRKNAAKKLCLHRETLRWLRQGELRNAAGAVDTSFATCGNPCSIFCTDPCPTEGARPHCI
jgi:hypothetical protein